MDSGLKYYRSINGVIKTIYGAQKHSSKRRNHELPSYTKQELKDWILSQPNFQELYDNWGKSGYEKDLKPSVDRLKDNLPYTLKNIRLTIWSKNNEKGNSDRRNGVNNKTSKKVSKYDLNGNFIESFYSIAEAYRKTGIYHSNISDCCNGKRKSAGKYIWKYD